MTTMRELGQAELREPPRNIDAEGVVLGGVMMHNGVFDQLSPILERRHFYDDAHKMIWEVISGLIEQGMTANAITCRTYLPEELAEGMPTAQYLAHLTINAVKARDTIEHAKLVRALWIRRQMIALTQELQATAFDLPVMTPAEKLFSDFEVALDDLRPKDKDQSDFRGVGHGAREAIQIAAQAYQRNGGIGGESTGLPSLDDIMGGLNKSDLIILAGRPGMGKTALATNIAVTVARRQQALAAAGQPSGAVAFNSLEMSAPQLAARIMSEISGVPSFRVKRGQVSEAEFHAFADAERELDKLPLEIDDTGGMNIAQLRNRARNLKKRKGGLALLVVDYLQLLAGSGKSRDGNRVQEVTEITVGLKALAKELDIPILALSQLSRKVEERDDKRPKLSDLRESGSIEQDADQVIFVFRDEYYLKGAEPPHEHQERHQEWARLMHYAKGVAEIIVAKNRHGPDGVAKVGFDAIHTRFKNEADEREEMAKPEKAKRETEIKFTAEAAVLFGALKSLSRTRYNLPTPEILHANRKLPKKARLIKMEDARLGFKAEAMPEADDADVAKRFTNTFKMLRSKEAAFYVGNDSTGYHVWLPSMVDAD